MSPHAPARTHPLPPTPTHSHPLPLRPHLSPDQAFEKDPANFVARVFLVGQSADSPADSLADSPALDDEWDVPSAVVALQHTFSGHTAVRVEAEVPMAHLKQGKRDAGGATIIVARHAPAGTTKPDGDADEATDPAAGDPTDPVAEDPGAGRLYYRLGLTYAPYDLQLPPLNIGFEVVRQYVALEAPSDVSFVNGVWRVKGGCLLKVTIHMTTAARRYHVALVDKLPAGFEPINPELKGAASTAAMAATGDDDEAIGAQRSYWWRRPWFEHQNLRDERVEVCAALAALAALATLAAHAALATPATLSTLTSHRPLPVSLGPATTPTATRHVRVAWASLSRPQRPPRRCTPRRYSVGALLPV